MRLTTRGAVALLGLFSVQFVTSILFSPAANRLVIVVLAGVYGLLSAVLLAQRFRAAVGLVRDGTSTPLDRLAEREERRARE